MKRTPAGLIIPGHLDTPKPERDENGLKKETWPKADVALMERLAHQLDAADRNVELLFVCGYCKDHKRPVPVLAPMLDQRTNEIILVCSCTERRLSRDI